MVNPKPICVRVKNPILAKAIEDDFAIGTYSSTNDQMLELIERGLALKSKSFQKYLPEIINGMCESTLEKHNEKMTRTAEECIRTIILAAAKLINLTSLLGNYIGPEIIEEIKSINDEELERFTQEINKRDNEIQKSENQDEL